LAVSTGWAGMHAAVRLSDGRCETKADGGERAAYAGGVAPMDDLRDETSRGSAEMGG